jgi:hypothetical protein
MALVIQNTTNSKMGTGKGLGYGTINPAYVIEFDTYRLPLPGFRTTRSGNPSRFIRGLYFVEKPCLGECPPAFGGGFGNTQDPGRFSDG